MKKMIELFKIVIAKVKKGIEKILSIPLTLLEKPSKLLDITPTTLGYIISCSIAISVQSGLLTGVIGCIFGLVALWIMLDLTFLYYKMLGSFYTNYKKTEVVL